jgi:hypothetical protein
MQSNFNFQDFQHISAMPTIEQRLLCLIDGGYIHEKACDCPKERIRSFRTTRAEFPLYTERFRIGCLGCGVVFSLGVIALIVVAICKLFWVLSKNLKNVNLFSVALLPLVIAIPVAVAMLMFGSCGICMFVIMRKFLHQR